MISHVKNNPTGDKIVRYDKISQSNGPIMTQSSRYFGQVEGFHIDWFVKWTHF